MYVCMYVCIYDICSNIYVYMIYMFYIISLYIYISNNQNIKTCCCFPSFYLTS